MWMVAIRNHSFLDIQVPTLIFAGAAAIIFLLHELSDVLEVVLSELVSIHRHIHVKLFYF